MKYGRTYRMIGTVEMRPESRSLLKDFLHESTQLITSMRRLQGQLQSGPKNNVALRELSREVHTLRGILLLVDFPRVSARAHRLQEAIADAERNRVGGLETTLRILDDVLRELEQIRQRENNTAGLTKRFEPTSSLPTRQTILIVDDSRTARHFLQNVLERAGFRAVTAATPDTAMAAIESSRPALIFLDMSVADQDSGNLLARMTSGGIFKRIPVVLFSQESEIVLEQRMKTLGATGYLQKTGNIPNVMAVVSAQLGASRNIMNK